MREAIRPFFGAIGLALFLLGASLAFFRGTLESSDEILMAHTTALIVEDFTLEFPQPLYGKTSSEYGLGVPLATIPAYVVEGLLRRTIILAADDATLAPLTNSLLFALIGVLAACMLRGERRWAYVALAAFASPALPISLTLYSELLAGAGLLGLTAALFRSADRDSKISLGWLATGALAASFFALTARMSIAPLLLLVLLWGWRMGAARGILFAGLFGLLAGGAVTGLQNLVLRGNIFATGYVGQDFVTPLPTGLFGLLVSPERGLLIFYPLCLAPFLAWKHLEDNERPIALLAGVATLFSLVFHGRFWTWHGGWTTGPRFLLPCILLYLPVVAGLFARRATLPAAGRLALGAALIWSALLAYIYSRHSAIGWWNRLWGFHRVENLWLFAPQMSLWQAWLEGVPIPFARPTFTRPLEVSLTSASLVCVILGLYPLLQPFRRTGGEPVTKTEPCELRLDRAILVCAGAVLLLLIIHGLSGPRGWKVMDLMETGDERTSHLLVAGNEGIYEGWLDFPLQGPVTFHIKANARYSLSIDGQTVLERTEAMPQHLETVRVDLRRGLVNIRARVASKDNVVPPLFELYWTWGGEGIFMAPAGGEYLLPRPLTSTERFFTLLWRRKFILCAGGLALLLLLLSLPGNKTRESLI